MNIAVSLNINFLIDKFDMFINKNASTQYIAFN